MSQPYGPQPGQPHPQAGQPVSPPDWSGAQAGAQQNPASGPFPQPYSAPPPQPYQGSGLPQPSYPAPEPVAQQPYPGSGPMPQPYPGSGPMPQPYAGSGPMQQPYPGSGPMPQQPYPGSGPMPQQPYPGSGPMPQQPYPGSGPMPQQPYPQPGHPAQPGQPMPQGYPQPGPPQQAPGMPQQQPLGPPPAGMGRVVLDSSYTPMAFMLALFKPGVTINGQPGPPAVWGRTVIDLPPGQHQIEVHVNYLWKFGSATAVIPVNAGQQVEAYYRSPMVAFGAGAIGPVPQSTPNVGLVVGLLVAWFVLCLLIFSLPMMLS